MIDNIKIDFSKLGGPVYTGRDNGSLARKKYNLDKIDKNDTHVIVLIPEDTFSLNSSFFLAFFGDSIRSAGSKENFLEKFNFDGCKQFEETINESIRRALFDKKPLI